MVRWGWSHRATQEEGEVERGEGRGGKGGGGRGGEGEVWRCHVERNGVQGRRWVGNGTRLSLLARLILRELGREPCRSAQTFKAW